MSSKKKLLERFWPIGVFVLIYSFIFRKIITSGLVPFPGDLLVAWFFPYKNGGWEGFTEWATHKEFILADVVRQIYPWKILSMDLLKEGMMPLWNIYSFSGNPLLANVQSAVFYPLNILFFLMENRAAWLVYVLIQPFMSGLFMYMFARSIKLSKIASLVAAIGFSYIGYTGVWFEMGTIGHAALWLPFILWGITKFLNTQRLIFLGASSLGVCFSIFAGHTQTTAYVLIIASLYLIIMGRKKLNAKKLAIAFFVILLGIGLAGVQIMPSYELMTQSARDAASSFGSFQKFMIPWSHISMLFAPDYLGNPAYNNFWGVDYGEFTTYAGYGILLLAAIGFTTQFRRKFVKLLLTLTVVSYLIAFNTPFATLLFHLNIPVLSTSIPSRAIFIASFCLVMTAAFGIETLLDDKTVIKYKKRIIATIGTMLGIYAILWIATFFMSTDAANIAVSKRNLILPTAIMGGLSFFVFVSLYFRKYLFVLWAVLFIAMGVEYSYFLNKYLPFAPAYYIFPKHELVEEIRKTAGVNRVYGYDSSHISGNLNVAWRVQNPEGYNPLYIKRYGQLGYAVENGEYSETVPRTDVSLPQSLAIDDIYEKEVFLDLTGTKYVLDKDDQAAEEWDPRKDRFHEHRFEQIYQNYKWRMYENLEALPRAAVFYDYQVIEDPEKTVNTLYDPNFTYRTTLIVKEDLSFEASPGADIKPVEIVSYQANSIDIEVDTEKPGLLFLSDNYYPGWEAYLDDEPVSILQTNHTFRGIEVPEGKHNIRFEYKPKSLYYGAALSAVSLLALVVVLKRKKL